jgi:mono/diheme cytochrome c family protein
MLHCSGCHGMDGSGAPGQGIPDFRNQIGHFQRLPDGRAFVMQVPGLLNAGLPDDRRAAVATWLVQRFAGPSLPADFQPYTAAEAKRYADTRPADIAARRKRLYEELLALGYPIR